MHTVEFNSKLEIKKIDHLKFDTKKFKNAYIQINGFAFYIEGKGYVAYSNKEVPYTPSGGKRALKAIIASGGFNNYDTMKFLQPIV